MKNNKFDNAFFRSITESVHAFDVFNILYFYKHSLISSRYHLLNIAVQDVNELFFCSFF